MNRIRLSITMAALVVCAMTAGRLTAGDNCHHCGECKETKYKLCLVRVYEQAELPIYACEQRTVFCPEQAAVEHNCYRCDTFMSLEKCGQTPMPVVQKCQCDSGCDAQGCDSHGCNSHACPPPTWAGQIYYQKETCTKESCSRLGASPCGKHVCHTVSLPNGEKCEFQVPVMKWVRVPVCDSCCHR